MKKIIVNNYFFLMCLLLFCLLLFKDPFSMRTLIPNFEPYPDSLYYINEARSFIKGYGFVVERDGRIFKPAIPPLYSLSLAPLFIVNPDPRFFYFTNIILALGSMFLFYKVLSSITNQKLLIGFILFLYVTNYFIYWMPTLAMAENLTLFLFMLSLVLLRSKISLINIILATVIGFGFYATKYASIPLTVTFLAIYLLKLIMQLRSNETKLVNLYFYFISVFTALLLIFLYEITVKSGPFLQSLVIFLPKPESFSSDITNLSPWFSLSYIKVNIWHYLNALFGGSEKFLWDYTPLVPKLVGVGGLLGLLVGAIRGREKFFSINLILMLTASVSFISTLYTYDIRYIYHVIPILLIGCGLLISFLLQISQTSYLKAAVIFLICVSLIYYGVTNVIRIKSQISLNLRYAETPWYYISILKLNEYFSADKISQEHKPIVITALPPYLVDFYTNGNYSLLPLSYEQEFRSFREIAWGPNDYSDLLKLYSEYIQKGYDVYLERYGLGNDGKTNLDYQIILNTFDVKTVMSGCYEQCNIYQLGLKSVK